MAFDRDDTVFKVVVNHEEQYSIWPDYKPVPKGWREVGKSGLKKECLDYIEEVRHAPLEPTPAHGWAGRFLSTGPLP